MKRIISLSIVVSLIFTLTGCDWIRSTLGMPTSNELKEFRQLTQQKSDTIPLTTPADSTSLNINKDKSQVNTTPANQAVQPVGDFRFYVIVGSFSEAKNADKMVSYLKKSGYNPIRLTFRNGYNVVASSAHKGRSDAFAALRKLLELDFSPDDIWVYDALKQKLHLEIK